MNHPTATDPDWLAILSEDAASEARDWETNFGPRPLGHVIEPSFRLDLGPNGRRPAAATAVGSGRRPDLQPFESPSDRATGPGA